MMAEIWLFSGVSEPVEEEELDERPFEECVKLLELTEDRYMGQDPTKAPAEVPKITNGEKYLVVAVDEEEAGTTGWKPGYDPSPLDPAVAMERLGLELDEYDDDSSDDGEDDD
jgi:hypothetical protein